MVRKPTYEELEKRLMELEQEFQSRKKTKGTLRKYELIFSAIQDPMGYIDRNYTCLAVNDVFLNMFNRSRQEIVGHTLEELLGRKTFEKRIKIQLDRCLAGQETSLEDWFEYPLWGRHYLVMNFYPFLRGRQIRIGHCSRGQGHHHAQTGPAGAAKGPG